MHLSAAPRIPRTMSETAGRGGGRRRKRPRKPKATTATPKVRQKARRKARPDQAGSAAAGGADVQDATGPAGRREVSAGGVVYRRVGDEIEVVLAARRTRRGDLAWGLAKGGLEEGESLEDAAVGRFERRPGSSAVIEESLGETRYFYVWEDAAFARPFTSSSCA